MPPGIGYGPQKRTPFNERQMLGDAIMGQFGTGQIDGTGRSMPGGGVVRPPAGAPPPAGSGAVRQFDPSSNTTNPGFPGGGAGGFDPGAGFTGRRDRLGVMGTPGLTPEQELGARQAVSALGMPIDPAEHQRRHEANFPGGSATGGMSRDQRDQLTWGGGQMSGFAVGSDYGGDMKARNSMKNTFGRIASNFESSPDGVRALVNDPAFRQAFPNARLIDHPTDPKIDFGGSLSDFESGVPVGVVDVLKASGQGGWQWLDEANDGAAGAGAGGGGMAAGAGATQMGARQGALNGMFGQMGNDATMAAILAEIQKYMHPSQMEALLGGALFEQMQGGEEPMI